MPTTPTHVLLNQITLTAASTATVTFSNIPAGYGDLVIVANANSSFPSSSGSMYLRFNQDASPTLYSNVSMQNTTGGTTSSTQSGSTTIHCGATGYSVDIKPNFIIQVMDYAATDKHKTALISTSGDLIQYSGYGTHVYRIAGRWANTAAINSITFNSFAGSASDFGAGSNFSLYGVHA